MSAITSDWTLSETEAPTKQSVKVNRKYSREEEFRSALDSYIADYQRHLDVMTGNTDRHGGYAHFTFFPRLAAWLRR